MKSMKLAIGIGLLAVSTFAGFAMGGRTAHACYQPYTTVDWCYDPFQCNQVMTVTRLSSGGESGYRSSNTVEYWCVGCDGNFTEEVGTDYGTCWS